MLRRVLFQNFKALADVALDLELLTVLVGANATGKTSVLEGIQLLCQAASTPPSGWGEFEWEGPPLERLLSGRTSRKYLSTGRRGASVTLTAMGDHPVEVKLGQDGQDHISRSPRTTEEPFPIAVRTSFELDRLAAPSFVSGERPQIAAHGSGLASVIAELLVDRSPTIDAIQDDLRRMFPLARRLRAPREVVTRVENEVLTINGREVLNPVERTYNGHRVELELDATGWLPAELLSEGTLLMLGLLTLLHTTSGPRVFLIDDLDRALHPRAQEVVVTALRRFVDEHPDVQVVCTSHSPFALDHFRPEEVRVMKTNRQGHARCRKLIEHPDWAYWKDMMKAGEFWSSVGEDWVYGEDAGAG